MVPGPIALFGSGETSNRGRQAHEAILQSLPVPARIAIVETPAGFQPNVDAVTAKLRAFFLQSLQNFQPQVEIVAARRRGSVYDPDSPLIAAPLDHSDYIFAGPGSPTYTIRQLADSLTLEHLRRRHETGGAISLASAAAIAFGRFALPVYEIYKVGEDLHWVAGLDIFGRFGLDVTVIPHWNNSEGGKDHDTSHCFMGAERFDYLRRMLPEEAHLLAIDEQTACILDLACERSSVLGIGQVRVIYKETETVIPAGEDFSLALLRTE